ncbi:MAG: cation:proton antiporter [Pricia sp.]
MMLLNIDIVLPFTDPVLKFLIILLIILFAPILLNKLKIPHLLGLIIAGAIIGPKGFNLMERDSGIILSGTAGLLYIMFLAGLEIDLADFKKNSKKSLVFGLYTFLIPMIMGISAGIYVLNLSVPTSVLLASMFASHTLIAYPLISKLGVAKNRAVNIAVGGTLITDTLALLVLAVVVGMTTGDVGTGFWLKLSVSIILFGCVVLLVFPLVGRWFFKRFDDYISQYIFVLAMVFLGAFLAELAGIEPIIGAFLSGLALNRLIPHTSPLMNRIEFVGNAIFIPFFLIGVGMLIDYRAFFKDSDTIKVAFVMVAVATTAKFVAAWLTQKTFRFSADERRLIFGLSNAQAAATLAAVLVGYNIIIDTTPSGVPVRLLNESILNGTILMILVTCTIATLIAQRGARNIALSETVDTIDPENTGYLEKILIPIHYAETTEELINLGATIVSRKHKNGLYALTVVSEEEPNTSSYKNAKKNLENAAKIASGTDNHLHQILRYDINTVNGISNVVKEHEITDLILGLHVKQGISDSFLGNLTEGILTKCNTTTLLYRPLQPLGTVKRHLIIAPPNAEKEVGFPFWLLKIWNIGRNSGAKMVFYGTVETLRHIKKVQSDYPIECEFENFDDWEDFLVLSRNFRKDDNLIIVLSRKHNLSYNGHMAKIPVYLNTYFEEYSFMVVYPMQSGLTDVSQIDFKNSAYISLVTFEDISGRISRLFGRK